VARFRRFSSATRNRAWPTCLYSYLVIRDPRDVHWDKSREWSNSVRFYDILFFTLFLLHTELKFEERKKKTRDENEITAFKKVTWENLICLWYNHLILRGKRKRLKMKGWRNDMKQIRCWLWMFVACWWCGLIDWLKLTREAGCHPKKEVPIATDGLSCFCFLFWWRVEW